MGQSLWLPLQVVEDGEKELMNRCSGVVHPVKVNLDKSSLVELNDYFAKLCSDDTYIEPTPVTISSELEIPVISEHQAWN